MPKLALSFLLLQKFYSNIEVIIVAFEIKRSKSSGLQVFFAFANVI